MSSVSDQYHILLLNPPFREPVIRDNYCCFTSKSGYVWAPIDLLYLSGWSRAYPNMRTSVIDAVATHTKPQYIFHFLKQNAVTHIFFLTGSASFIDDMRLMGEIYRAHPKIKLYALGNTPCFEPRLFLARYPFLSGIVHNFFDHSLFECIFQKGSTCRTISTHSHYGTINLERISVPIDVPPPQYNLFPLKQYVSPLARKRPFTTSLTSFGCPFQCTFCIASRLTFHKRSLKSLSEEFRAMKTAGIKEIFFEDSTFNTNTKFTESVCNLLIETRGNFSWSANIHSFNINESILRHMKRAGCHTVQIGVESGSEHILTKHALSKTKDKITQSFNLARDMGLDVLGYFIIGFPEETAETVQSTIDFAKRLNPRFASFSTLTPDYGTAIRDKMLSGEKSELISFDSSSSNIPVNTQTPEVDIAQYVKKAYLSFYFRLSYVFSHPPRPTALWSVLRNALHLIFKKIL